MHAWQHVSMACSKLEAMAIYLVKQVCGNDILLGTGISVFDKCDCVFCGAQQEGHACAFALSRGQPDLGQSLRLTSVALAE